MNDIRLTRWGWTFFCCVVFWAASSLTAMAADGSAPIIERARQAYAKAGAFHETLDIAVTMPDGKASTTRQDYGTGPRGSSFVRLTANGRAGLRIIGTGDRIVAIWERVEGRHVENAYAGNLAGALTAIEAGQLGLAAPPSVVAAQGGSEREFRDALRFGILSPIQSVRMREGSPNEVSLVAESGQCIVSFDQATGRFRTLTCTLGAAPNQVRAEGKFAFTQGETKDELEIPDTSGSVAISTLTMLEASDYPLGDKAPEVRLTTLDGRSLDLATSRGRYVVLDFWATWCVPCWAALEQTERLTEWAANAPVPVTVYAVNSLERGSGLDERRGKVKAFVAERNLSLNVLLDVEDSAFSAFHKPGLPSLIIIDREGRIVDYHSGVLPDMVETVKAKLDELTRD